jgi:hexosaminidase
MKSKLIAAMAALSLAATALAVNEPAIIPQPQSLTRLDGAFKLAPDTRIYTDPASADTGGFLAERLRKPTGYSFRISPKTTPDLKVNDGILLTTSDADSSLGAEGYELVVGTNAVVIRAPTQAGLFYGVQTLLQLLPPEIFSAHVVKDFTWEIVRDFNWEIPCVKITDQPRFGWRGLMLDVSRHFFTKEEVKQMLDAMALHKLNSFHWHLTDDQGWRIEIKKYPKLTSVGAWRDGVGFGLAATNTTAYGPDGRYGGFYTQDDIREVVAYAEKLHINIVPEIEMPGHSLAALSAYPEYGSGPGPFKISMGAGVNPGIFSPAKDETFEFLQNVLTEVFELFPSKYIHIGGDEVPKGPWKKDEACQALMKRENLKDEQELQSWFNRRMEKFINAHGKTLLGWSEILQGGLAQNAAIMDWIGGAREAASTGHDVVMSPTSHCYFDFYQTKDQANEPKAMGYGGALTLQKVYSFEPIPAKLAPEMQKHILGAQGNVWTEYIENIRHVEYMAFPRLSALSEVTWSPKEARNFDDFVRRLKTDNQRLDQLGVNYRLYRPETRTQIGGWKPEQIKNELSPLEWDVTKNVTAAGKCAVSLEYTAGACGIDIAWVALLEDDKEIARDTHDGFTGSSPRKPVYSLDIPAPKAGAHYTLRAMVAGSGGTDSAGNVFWGLKPAAK